MRKGKPLLLFLSFISIHFILSAQIIPVKNALQTDLAKVINDYPNHFKNFVGELLVENPQSTDYKSLLVLKGAEECTVTKYSATGKEVYSWQALMLKTESFDEASKKFYALYNSLQNLSVHVASSDFVFKASYERPVEEKKFTSLVFKNSKEEKIPSRLRLELSMEYQLLEWEVKILIYDRDREDDERGQIKEQ